MWNSSTFLSAAASKSLPDASSASSSCQPPHKRAVSDCNSKQSSAITLGSSAITLGSRLPAASRAARTAQRWHQARAIGHLVELFVCLGERDRHHDGAPARLQQQDANRAVSDAVGRAHSPCGRQRRQRRTSRQLYLMVISFGLFVIEPPLCPIPVMDGDCAPARGSDTSRAAKYRARELEPELEPACAIPRGRKRKPAAEAALRRAVAMEKDSDMAAGEGARRQMAAKGSRLTMIE